MIVDWRDSVFLKDRSRNYFTEFFAAVPEIDGVRIHYAPSPELDDYERSAERDRIELSAAALAEAASRSSSAPVFLQTRHSLRLDRTPDSRTSYRAFLRDFYRRIVLRPELAEQLESWYDANLRGHFTVGVNVATGNGIFAPGGTWEGHVNIGIFEDERRFLRTIEFACEQATAGLPVARRGERRLFFATDSAHMAGVLGRLPGAVTRRTVFPPAGSGRQFRDYDALGYSDRAAAADTIIDMLLLGRCDALVRNSSRFSLYARVITRNFGGNVQKFEKLHRRLAKQLSSAPPTETSDPR